MTYPSQIFICPNIVIVLRTQISNVSVIVFSSPSDSLSDWLPTLTSYNVSMSHSEVFLD